MEQQENNQDLFDLCAPATGGTNTPPPGTRLYPLSNRGLGYTGARSQTLACILVKETNQFGAFQGEALYPVAAYIQQDPRISRHIRTIEFHSTITSSGETGLLYYKLPISGLPPNTWLASAKQAVDASAECWGHFNSDHMAQAYQFIPADDQLPAPEQLPGPKKLIREILGERVITSMDHPAMQQLLGASNSPSTANNDKWGDESAY